MFSQSQLYRFLRVTGQNELVILATINQSIVFSQLYTTVPVVGWCFQFSEGVYIIS